MFPCCCGNVWSCFLQISSRWCLLFLCFFFGLMPLFLYTCRWFGRREAGSCGYTQLRCCSSGLKWLWFSVGFFFGWTYCYCKSVKTLPLFKMYRYFFQHFHKFESTLVDVHHKRALKTAPTTESSSFFSATLFSLSRGGALVRRHATATRTSNTTRQGHNTTRACMFSSCTKHCSILDCITQTHEHISIAQEVWGLAFGIQAW